MAAGAVGLLFLVRYLLRRHTWTLRVVTAIVRLSQRFFRRPRGDARQLVDQGWARLTAVTPGRPVWVLAFAFAAGNWLWDCLALALSFLAVGSGVPWQGLLLAYGAAQLAIKIVKGDKAGADSLASSKVMDTKLNKDVPSVLLEPEPIYKDNVKDVIADGFTTKEKVCANAALQKACAANGIS